jgi:hypothetical protein
MGLKITRVFGDEDGETHLADIELSTEAVPSANGVATVVIPTTSLVYAEYPEDGVEMIPGFHCAPRRQFVISLEGAFEVTSTSGDVKRFQPGDWLLADDVDTRGHITKGIGTEPRVNLVIAIESGWSLPGGLTERTGGP